MRWRNRRRSSNVEDRRGTRMVRPDSFTHGSSAQRVRWFKKGIIGGDINSCDTFSAASL